VTPIACFLDRHPLLLAAELLLSYSDCWLGATVGEGAEVLLKKNPPLLGALSEAWDTHAKFIHRFPFGEHPER